MPKFHLMIGPRLQWVLPLLLSHARCLQLRKIGTRDMRIYTPFGTCVQLWGNFGYCVVGMPETEWQRWIRRSKNVTTRLLQYYVRVRK
jgi:hypothetical protein